MPSAYSDDSFQELDYGSTTVAEPIANEGSRNDCRGAAAVDFERVLSD